MIALTYELTSYRGFLADFADFLGIHFLDNKLLFPEHYGSGYIKLIELTDDMEAIVSCFTLKHDVLFERKKDEKEYYTFICEEISGAKEYSIQIESDKLELTNETRSAMYLTSFLYDVKYFLKQSALVRSVRILLSEKWMKQYLGLDEKKSVLEKYIAMKTAGVWFKKVDVEAKELLNELLEETPVEKNLLFFQTRILRLVEKFFSSLNHEIQLLPTTSGISHEDIANIIKIESIIANDLSSPPPTIPQLARIVALSESKLKKLFKAVYGLPPYEYYQKQRMEKARHMLLTGKYSIKDVGYALGYANLSNFTLAFKKEYGELPSTLLKK
jgi:AraC-like DNA-binding protein